MPAVETEAPLVGIEDPADVAIPKLLAAHGGTIYRIGLRLCGNPDDAEELAQETFVNAWRGWDRFEGRAKPTTWLYTIAARVCQRRKRLRSGEPAQLSSWEDLTPAGEDHVQSGPTPPEDPYTALTRHEAQRVVDRAIGQVPEPFRLPLVLKDIAGLSLAEIGEALGVRPATIKTRVHRGRNALRLALEEAASEEDEVSANGEALPATRQDHGHEGGICHSLLEARQEALDRGAPFPVPEALIDERCRGLLTRLELAHDLCRVIAEEGLPEEVERRLLEACRESSADPTA